jgi:HK97 family phage major capsid protein
MGDQPGGTATATAPPRTLQEIVARQQAIQDELRGYTVNPPTDLDEAQRREHEQWCDTLIGEYDTLEAQRQPLATRMARLEAVLNAGQHGGDVGTGDGTDTAAAVVTRTAGGVPAPTGQVGYRAPARRDVRRTRDPFEPQAVEAARAMLLPRSEFRERALDAIERAVSFGDLSDGYAERATRVAQDDVGIQRHVILTGSPEYREAFDAYLRNPEENAQRAALSLTLANGGYMLPYVLDPTIVITNTGSANPWRRIGNNKQTTSNTWNGVTSAGVSAGWLAENTEVPDSTPTVGNIQITPQKAAAWVFGSYEVLQDTDFATELPALLADARDRLEEAAFAAGTGTGQPRGVITGASTSVTASGVATYAIGDIYALQAALPARFRNAAGAAMVMGLPIINRTRQFDTAGGASFWTNLGAGQPERVLGVPLYESTTMASVLTTGSKIAVYGDFGQFYIVDRVGVSLMYEPMVKGSNNRPTGQAGWFMYWRTGSDVATPSAFRVLTTG